MSEPPGWLHPLADGATVEVRVGPGARRPGLAGVHGGALRVRVSARPVEGAANRELLEILAALLGVRPGALTIEAGTRGCTKRVRVRGVAADAVAARLAAALAAVDTSAGRD